MADFRPVIPVRAGNITLLMKAPTVETAEALKAASENESPQDYANRLRDWACSDAVLIDYLIDGKRPAIENWREQVATYILAHVDDVVAVVAEVAFRPRTELARSIEARSIGLAP